MSEAFAPQQMLDHLGEEESVQLREQLKCLEPQFMLVSKN
jgi:hypothetical protein